MLYSGGAKGTRTPDLLNAIQALSQLSYSPLSAPDNYTNPYQVCQLHLCNIY